MEHYAEKSHGLFPRFVVGASGLALLQFLLYLTIALLTPIEVHSGLGIQPRFEALDALSALFPLVFFGFFYLIARVRVNLGSDYASVAASIFLGSLMVTFVEALLGTLPNQSENFANIFDVAVQSAGSAVFTSAQFTFIGFAAVLLSFRRRM